MIDFSPPARLERDDAHAGQIAAWTDRNESIAGDRTGKLHEVHFAETRVHAASRLPGRIDNGDACCPGCGDDTVAIQREPAMRAGRTISRLPRRARVQCATPDVDPFDARRARTVKTQVEPLLLRVELRLVDEPIVFRPVEAPFGGH